MSQVALLYHDVVEDGDFHSSGFPSAGACVYKLAREEFSRHLDAIAVANPNVLLTFDDGGISFYETIAPALERHSWRGHFFIATDWIGSPGFLNEAQIRELRQRGHVIGTHSCSHPPRMSHCSFEQIVSEWTQSSSQLSDIINERVETGSVPGGYFSRKVATAAAAAGLRTLFTSEPTLRIYSIDECVIRGRFTIRHGDEPSFAASLAAAESVSRMKQAIAWNAKKVLKTAGGTAWLKLRERILERSAV
jgi:peptidoglycan/xylan/chitin deacetylase (PgdA/CDA1 family)